jgi:hypothetical protein
MSDPQNIPPPVTLAESPIGRLRFEGNEEMVESTIEDPPKTRWAAASGGALGCLSANRLRPDGKHDEKVLLIFKDTPEGGTYDFFGLKPGVSGGGSDADMVRLMTLSPKELELFVPLKGATAPAPGTDPRVWHEGNRYLTIYQNDGNIVTYDTHNSPNEATWTPKWSSFTGPIN